MEEKNNFDFENKVKNKNKCSKIFFFVRLIIVFVVFVTLSIYLFSPLSSIDSLVLEGNMYLTRDDIFSVLNINNPSSTSLYSINEKKVEEMLNYQSLFIKNADYSCNPFSSKISLQEDVYIACYNDKYYSTNGNESESIENESLISYVNRIKEHQVYFVNEPIKNDYFNEYLILVAQLNLESNSIRFVESGENEKTFILYYFDNGKSIYYRVELKYNEDEASNYLKQLVFDDSLKDSFESVVSKKNAEKKSMEINNILIEYYDLKLRINGNELTFF